MWLFVKDLSDEQLLDLYHSGDARAFLEFYSRHSGRIAGYAIKKGMSREAADEVSQESFLRLHRSIHHYEKGRPALPWFFTLVHNCLIDAFRDSIRMSKVKADYQQHDRNVGFNEQANSEDSDAMRALVQLPFDQKKVIELRVFSGKSFKEISNELKQSEVGLRKIFERAKKKIKKIMSEGN
ncbi:MAG: RNA polymerase sigma factor [Proteobacteria bacterium]|nr:MAG: RNA polymerase sigma factor [Pseudomonadota bacterium]